MSLKPFTIWCAPRSARASGADVAQIGATLYQQTRHQQLRAFIATERDATFDRGLGQCAFDGTQHDVFHHVNVGLRHIGGIADGLQPSFCAVMTHWGRAHNGTARRFKFANAGGVKRMDGGHD